MEELPVQLRRRFELLDLLGTGSFGRVHRVLDREAGEHRALKQLSAIADPARVEREVEIHRRLDHAHVIRLHEAFRIGDESFLLLELADGSLADLLPDPTNRRRAFELVLQAAEGVAALHRVGLVHRDLKPENILHVGAVAKVADLGLARAQDLATLTRTGVIQGTPSYMAPEQARGEKPSPAWDVHALGMVLYRVLEGRLPHHGSTPIEILIEVARGPDVSLSHRTLRELGSAAEALQAALDPQATARPTDLSAWTQALREHPPSGDASARETSPRGASPRDRTVIARHPPSARRSAPASTRAMVGSAVPRGSATPDGPPVRAAAGRPGHDGRRRPWRAFVLGGLALLGSILFLLPSEPAAPPSPSPAAPHAAPAPFDDAWLRRAREQLQALLAAPPASLRDGRGDLSRDPLQWGAIVERLPAVREAYEWLADGGRVEELAESPREHLRELGHVLEEHGLPDPLGPVLDLRPSPEEAWPEELELTTELPLRRLRSPGRLSGWSLAAVRAADRALAAWIPIRQALSRFQRHGDEEAIPEALRRSLALDVTGFLSKHGGYNAAYLFRSTFRHHAPVRIAIQAWLGDGPRHYQALLHALMRAGETDDVEEGSHLAQLLMAIEAPSRHLAHSHLADLPPEWVLGRRPRTRVQYALTAWFSDRQVRARALALEERRRALQRSVSLWRAALPPPESRAPRDAVARLAFDQLVTDDLLEAGTGTAPQVLEAFRSRRLALAATAARQGTSYLARAMARLQSYLERASIDEEIGRQLQKELAEERGRVAKELKR